MTNEQLTQEVMNLKEHQAKAEAEHEKFELILKELQEDIRTTKNLAEDVHIMAINMESMQKTMNDTNKKVDALTSKEFVEYKENKKLVKQKILSAIVGSVITVGLGVIAWILTGYVKGGGL